MKTRRPTAAPRRTPRAPTIAWEPGRPLSREALLDGACQVYAGGRARLESLVRDVAIHGDHVFVTWAGDVPADADAVGAVEAVVNEATRRRGRLWHEGLDIDAPDGARPSHAYVAPGARGQWFGHGSEWGL